MAGPISGNDGNSVMLLTCSSPSNVGSIAIKAALVLTQYHPGHFEWGQAKQSNDMIEAIASSCDRFIVIDGCPESCGVKKLSGLGISVDGHVVVTDLLGIKKSMAEVKPLEVEQVVKAVDRL